MGEAKRRKTVLGDRYGKNTTRQPIGSEQLEFSLVRRILYNHISYRNRFSFIGKEVVEDKSVRVYTADWCVAQLRNHPNAFKITSKILGDSYWTFLEEVINPVVGENLAIYHVSSREPLFPMVFKTEMEAIGRLGILFLQGRIRTLSDCAFVFHRWDIAQPSRKFNRDEDIRAYVLDKTSIQVKERYVKLLAKHNIAKRLRKIIAKGCSRNAWDLIAHKLQVDKHRLIAFYYGKNEFIGEGQDLIINCDRPAEGE